GLVGGAEPLACVHQFGLIGQRLAHRGGEDLVQVRGDVDLGHPGADRTTHAFIADPGGTVQHQWHVHGGGDLDDQVLVQGGAAGGNRVRGAHGHGEQVHAGGGGELVSLAGVGAHAGIVHSVLSADLPQLCFHADAAVVCAAHHIGGGGDVLLRRQARPVVHDRGEAQLQRFGHQVQVLGVVQMHCHRDLGGTGHVEGARGDRGQCAVILDGVLGDLQDHGGAGTGGGANEHFGVVQVDHVEGSQPRAGGAGLS